MYYLVVNSFCRSTESVVAMAPEVRGCLTAAEPQYPPLHVELFAFRDYTKSSCLLECRAAAMLRLCQVRLGPGSSESHSPSCIIIPVPCLQLPRPSASLRPEVPPQLQLAQGRHL